MFKKIIVTFMMVMIFMVTGNVASAHTSIYTNHEVVEDSEDYSNVSYVVYDHNGFRAELNLNSYDTEEVQYQKGYEFGYAVGNYVTSTWLNELDHPVYVIQLRDGVVYEWSVGTISELYYELTGINLNKGIDNV